MITRRGYETAGNKFSWFIDENTNEEKSSPMREKTPSSRRLQFEYFIAKVELYAIFSR